MVCPRSYLEIDKEMGSIDLKISLLLLRTNVNQQAKISWCRALLPSFFALPKKNFILSFIFLQRKNAKNLFYYFCIVPCFFSSSSFVIFLVRQCVLPIPLLLFPSPVPFPLLFLFLSPVPFPFLFLFLFLSLYSAE